MFVSFGAHHLKFSFSVSEMRPAQWVLQHFLRRKPVPFWTCHHYKLSTFPHEVDRYQGIHVDLSKTTTEEKDGRLQEFEKILTGMWQGWHVFSTGGKKTLEKLERKK